MIKIHFLLLFSLLFLGLRGESLKVITFEIVSESEEKKISAIYLFREISLIIHSASTFFKIARQAFTTALPGLTIILLTAIICTSKQKQLPTHTNRINTCVLSSSLPLSINNFIIICTFFPCCSKDVTGNKIANIITKSFNTPASELRARTQAAFANYREPNVKKMR